jgi:hypothetical protein
MKQQCHLSMIWLSWLLYLGGLAWFVWHHQWIAAVFWLFVAPLAQWFYIRRFPRISAAMGYGSVADHPAPRATLPTAPVQVTLYTALGCPFCPLIEQRLESLRSALGFRLEKIDVTFRPDLLASRGIRSVPAVDIGGRILTGLQTTRDLAAAIVQPGVAAAP